MTKKLWTICLMAIFALSATAQTHIGKWKSDPETDQDGTMVFVFNFINKKDIEVGVSVSMSDEETDLSFDITLPGTYTIEDNTLSLNIDTPNTKFDIKKLQFKGETADAIKENPDLEKTIRNMVNIAVKDQKDEILKELPVDGGFVIKELTSTRMVLSENDDTIILNKVK